MRDSSIPDMAQRKKQARVEALVRRDVLGDSVRAEKSALISDRLIHLDQFQKSRCVFIYSAVRSEVHTEAIMQAALAMRKTVCVPLIDVGKKVMLACAITDPAHDLHPGTMGLPEPDRQSCPVISTADIDLAIVPGLAFTVQGHRIGYGGGYYDKFLHTWPGTGFALAFEAQIIACLPFDPDHDAVVSRIITEQRDIACVV